MDGPDDLQADWFEGINSVLVTAGASAPESVVEQVLDYLRINFDATVEVRSIRKEEVHFQLPKELRSMITPRTN